MLNRNCLSTLSSNPTRKLDILWHNCNPLGMYRAQIGIFEQADQISFDSLLESKNSGALEAKIGLEILGNFPNQTLEGQLPYQKLGAFLIFSDLTQSNGSWPVAVRLFHAATSRSGLAGRLRGELLPGGLAAG